MQESHVNPADFDFDKVVAALKRDYPREARDIVFVDTSKPGAQDILREFYEEYVTGRTTEDAEAAVDALVQDSMEDPWAHCYQNDRSGRKLLVCDSAIEAYNDRIFASAAQQMYFSLYHEAGHLIVPGGYTFDNEIRDEMTADCFAVLRCLAQNVFGVDVAEKYSDDRVKMDLSDGHVTSLALDTMLADMTGIHFNALTAREIQNIAAFYAKACAATAAETKQLQSDAASRLASGAQWLENMIDICEGADAHSFTFYTTAKKLSQILTMGAVEEGGEKIPVNVDSARCDEAREMIARRASRIGAPYLVYKP